MNSIEKLKVLFEKFPTIGQKTASRFVYYLIKLSKERVDELILAIEELKSKIKLCHFCFNPFEPTKPEEKFCLTCKDPRRDKSILCIVEKEADLLSIEATKKYMGFYFILGGTISIMRKEDISRLRIQELKSRIKSGSFSEIIVALNSTPEGRATSVLIEQDIKETSPKSKITHLAKGIPVGGELEYADEETLESALEGRK